MDNGIKKYLAATLAGVTILLCSACSADDAVKDTAKVSDTTASVSEVSGNEASDAATSAEASDAVNTNVDDVTHDNDIAVRAGTYEMPLTEFTYFYNLQYRNTMKTYAQYYEIQGLDPQGDIKRQSDGKWFDFFMTRAKADVELLLAYAAYAEAQGLTLDDAAMAEIDSTVAELTETCNKSNHALSTYLALSFGNNVSEDVFRSCLALQKLAALGQTAAGETAAEEIKAQYPAAFDDTCLSHVLPVTIARAS